MKKVISLICSITMLVSTISIAFPAFAGTMQSVDSTIESLAELYQDEAESGKELEESAKCRIIVKASKRPEMHGNAQYVKGTGKTYIYQYSNITEAEKALKFYNSLSYVEWAEADGVMECQSLSYGNDMLGSEEAKAYVKNNDAVLSNEIKVALIDTGILLSGETANQYAGRIEDSGCNSSDSGIENSALADNQHGPKIASIILDNTSDNVKVIGYKAANKNNKTTSLSLSLAIDAATKDNADIISISISGTTYSHEVEEKIKTAVKNGIIVICSAGNSSDDVSKYYPANMDEVFTVGAIDKNGNRTFFSNFGEEIDFVAPGHYVETKATNTVTKEMGTSFSVPFIDAAAAMVLSAAPNLTPDEVKKRLKESCVPAESLAYHDGFHAIEEYDINDNGPNNPKRFFAVGDAPSEDLYYGNGMPQILKAMTGEKECSAVQFSVQPGTYNNEFELTLTADEDTDIYYTTDESYPSKNSAVPYTRGSTIPITATTSIRAIAYTKNGIKSIPTACEYKMEYYANENDFSVNSDGYITEYSGNLTEFIVPESVNGITVKGIDEWVDFKNSDEIIGITLPDTATELESDSLVYCTALKYFSGKGITTIGDSALACEELLTCDTPNVEYIGDSGLNGKMRTAEFPKLKYAGSLAFYGMPCLSYVSLPSLQNVEFSTFANCFVLRTVELNNVQTIDGGAFSNCYRLKNITAPNLTELMYSSLDTSGGTFASCYNLTAITDENFPKLKSIAPSSFANDVNLKEIDLTNAEYVGNGAFYYTGIENINLPNAKHLGNTAFSMTPYLKIAYLPNVEILDNAVFRNSGVEIFIAPNLKTIGSYCFSGYSEIKLTYNISNRLKSFYAPELEAASDYAFAYLGGLTEIELPKLEAIGENAFYESSVDYLYAPSLKTASSLPTADEAVIVTSNAFNMCNVEAPNEALYIQGEKGSFAEDYANEHNLEFIDVNAMGRSIRVTDAGLRFGYSFYDTQDKAVDEYGFIYDYANTDDLKINSENAISTVAHNRLSHDDGTTTYNLVFTGIPTDAYDTLVSARAYVKIGEKYFYSDILKGSFNEVAGLVLADNEIDEATKGSLRKTMEAA